MTAVFADGWSSASGAEFVRSFVTGPQAPHVSLLAPVLPGLTHRVRGRIVRAGRSSNLADAWIEDPDGRLLTRASGIFQPNRGVVPQARWEEAGIA